MAKKKKGRSHSTRPVSNRPPVWCSYQPMEVEALIIKYGKEGYTTSKIGEILRDQYGIPLVKPIAGKSISKIIREAGLAPQIPEDLSALLRKADSINLHLEKNDKDVHNKRALQLIEAKIRRLSKYYINNGVLPSDWKY